LFKKEREPWEKSVWEKCENKRGRVLVIVVGAVLFANALIQPFVNLSMLSIVGIAAMLVISFAFYQALKWTRVLILISAIIAPIASVNAALVRYYDATNQQLDGVVNIRMLDLMRYRTEGVLNLSALALMRPMFMAAFLFFVVYAIFIDSSTLAYLKNLRDKRRPPFPKKKFKKKT